MPRIHRRLLLSVVYSVVLIFGANLSMRPVWAAPASCSPTANGNTGSGSRTNAQGTQYCTGGDTGIAYDAKGGDLIVNLDNDPITGHAININDDGNARNITVNDGLPSAGYTAAAILANDSSNFAVNLQSSGGNIQFTTYAGGVVSYTGASPMGAAIGAQTSGTGTITIVTNDTATDLAGTGIGGVSSAGAVNIWADGNVTAGSDAIYASSGGGDITVTTGSASNPVTIATTATDIHDAVNATSAGGNVSVTTYGASLGELLAGTTGTGNVTIVANGDVTASGGNAAIYASVGSGTVGITTNGNVTDSVVAIASANGNIAMTTNGNVDEPNGFASIYAASSGGNIVLTTNGSLTDGLNASTSGAGTVNVTANGNISNAQAFDSIYATTVDGNVGVTVNSALITGATGGYGVEADAFGAGNSTVTLGNGVTIDPPTVGAYSYSYSGLSSVSTGNNDVITASDTTSAGSVIAKSDLAPATAMVTASVTTGTGDTFVVSGDESAGINSVNRGDGLGGVSVTTGSGNVITVTGDDDAAILGTTIDDNFATGHFDGAGNVTIKIGAGNVLTVNPGTGAGIASGDVVAASDGGNIDVEWTGAGGSITVNGAPGIATGGILAVDGSGAVATPTPATNAQTVTVVTGSGTAISSNNGAGMLVANLNFGLTTVTSNGPIVAAVSTGSPVVSAFLASAPNPSFANVEGGGIIALGVGPTAVTSNAAITMTGGDGIDVLSETSVSVSNNAAIVASNSGIDVYSQGVLAITNKGSVKGAGSASHPVIAFAAGGPTTIANGAGGTVQSTAGLPTDLAIAEPIAGAGSVVIANGGAITGRLDLANTSGASLNNSGVWTSSGTSAFPGAGVVSNTGTVRVSGTTTFAGLQTFNNTGVLDMHGANAAVGDVATISGAYVGGGKLVIDSFLGTAGSGGACGALSDCLQIGSSSGVTGVVVHDTATIANAGINSSGILLVSGASSAGNFVLDPSSSGFDPHTGAIDEGVFSYSLGYNASAHQVLLYAAPNVVAFQLPALGTAAQNLWYETSPWLNRQADLRDQLGEDGQGKVSPGIWVKGVANFLRRDATVTYMPLSGGPGSSQDAWYGQDSYGLVVGGDVATQGVLTSGDTLLGGVMAGYVASNVDFDSTQTTADFSGVLLGAYATYLSRGWVIDAAFKANLLKVKYLQGAGSVLAANPNAVSAGGQLDAGKRFAIGGDVFVEPLGSISYLSTSIGDTAIGANTVHFGEDRSARGSAGLRLGMARQYLDGTLLDVSLTGRVWDEFDGNDRATLASGGSASMLSDRFSGVFGELTGSANVFGTDDGWSGFFNAGVKFRNDFTSETLTAGVRYHW